MKLFWKSSVLAVLLSTAACGIQRQVPQRKGDDPGIVGGSIVQARDPITKSVVAIVAEKNRGQALCTGTLLGKDIILTAAHCVDDSPAKVLIVFNLNVQAAKADEVRTADAYVQNENWKHPSAANGSGDLALIHFDGGLPNGFAAVKLAPRTFKLEKGTTVTFAGYGVTDGTGEKGSGQLRETETTVVGDSSPTEVLTDGRQHGVCFGDSGGPAFVIQNSKVVQWGVASSVTNHSCRQLSVHTSVMSYRAWITAKIRELRGHEE